MGETKHDGLAIPGRVVLAHEPAFHLGPVSIDPPTRQVLLGSDQFTLEPRVMQVLVALAGAKGRVLTRDELVDCCWEGRIVGDDAINRTVRKLRQLAELSESAFRIETIPRVGYRLIGDGEAQHATVQDVPRERAIGHSSRRMFIGSGLGIGAVAIGGGLLALRLRRHDPPPLARRYFERGLATRGQGYSTEYEQAVGYFRRAVQVDPDYADAWGALAWSYRTLLATEDRPDTPRLAVMARSAAERALELDPANADAQAALLLLKSNFQRWAEVERGLRRLTARHPGHSISEFQLGYVLSQTGRWREAIPPFEAVSDREPLWPMAKFRLFEALSNSGRIEEADAQIDEVNRLAPRNLTFWAAKIQHLMLTGRETEAVSWAANEAARPLDERRWIDQELMILDGYVSRSPELRKETVHRLLDIVAEEEPIVAFEAAISAALLGELDTAFSLLDGYLFGRGAWAAKRDRAPPTNALFKLATKPLWHDGRFARLLEEVGLEAFWRETRTQPDFRLIAST